MNLAEAAFESKPKTSGGLRLGVRAHDLGRMPAEALASRLATAGFFQTQLALNKAISGWNIGAGNLNAAMAREVGSAFARQGVGIEVLGCYINPIHPDRATRAAEQEFFKDHLRFAREFGCGLVALESGSVNPDYSPHPANHSEAAFNDLIASLSGLVAVAEENGVDIGLEAVTSHTVSTPRKMRRVLDTLRSKHLRVVLDPVNLLAADTIHEQSRVVAEALELLGDEVAVIHAKDFIYEDGVMKTMPAGLGQLDYAPVLDFVRQRRSNLAVILEEADEKSIANCAAFLRQKYEEITL